MRNVRAVVKSFMSKEGTNQLKKKKQQQVLSISIKHEHVHSYCTYMCYSDSDMQMETEKLICIQHWSTAFKKNKIGICMGLLENICHGL